MFLELLGNGLCSVLETESPAMRHETEPQIRRLSDILVLQILPALGSECVRKLQLFYLLS